MKLIIPNSVKKLDLFEKIFTLQILKNAARKSLLGLGYKIKIPANNLLISKINITTKSVAARALYLIQLKDEIAVFILIRKKSDKLLGQNMSIQNSQLEHVLSKYLDLIYKDLASNNYQEFEL
jgi:hypothetical protein